MTLLLRVSGALDVYGAVGADSDIYFTLVVQILCFGAFPAALYCITCARLGNRNFLKAVACDFGVKKVSAVNWARIVLIGICMTVTATMISYVWNTVLSFMGYTRVSSSTDYSGMDVLFAELALTAMLPAVFEELTHRGLLYAGYRDSGWKFVLVSAVLFSLMHQNIAQTGYTFYDGIIIALIMYYTGSIWPGIYVHFFNNAISVIQGYAAQNGGPLSFINAIGDWLYGSSIGFATFVLIAVAMFGLLLLLFVFMRKDAVKKGIIDQTPFGGASADALPLRKDAILIVTVLVGVAATLFSLVWGIMR